jgi:hypothetical protein
MRGAAGVAETFVIFGGYGSGQINSGLQKQLFEAFPEQMSDLKQQAMSDGGGQHGEVDEQDVNMANQGRVWAAHPVIASSSGPIHLVSCAAYPRGQSPSEREHVRRMFHRALAMVIRLSAQACSLAHGRGCSSLANNAVFGFGDATQPRVGTVRIVTHAIGSFVGHSDPSVFAWGLANGVNDLLADIRPGASHTLCLPS